MLHIVVLNIQRNISFLYIQSSYTDLLPVSIILSFRYINPALLAIYLLWVINGVGEMRCLHSYVDVFFHLSPWRYDQSLVFVKNKDFIN